MTQRDKQIEAFVNQAEQVAREWTIAEIEGRDTHPVFANKMYLIHELAKSVFGVTDDEEKENDD